MSAFGRRWLRPRNVLIVVYLLVQILLPLSYYASSDVFDERFAWRMFSPIRVTPCDVRFSETGPGGVRRPVAVTQHVQIAWLELMRRARIDVVRGFTRARCAQMQAEVEQPGVWVDIRCEHADGVVRSPIPPDENLCEPSP